MRPDLGHIEDVPPVFLCFLGTHQLHVHFPRWIVASFNSLKHVLDHIVWVLAGEPRGLLTIEILDSLL